MATLIGIVSKVIGQVFAQASDGTRRALIEGDRLFAGDQLVTGAEGAVAVHLQNGQELTLGRGSSLQMNSQLLGHQVPHVETTEAATPTQAQLSDVERVQKAIAAGDDPTQTAEATAAGPGTPGAPGGAAGGGHSFVLLEEVAGRVDPTVGFPTAGFNGVPEFPLERLAGDPDNGDNGAAAPIGADTPDVPNDPETPDHPVTLNGLDVAGGELTVYEKNLTYGTDPDNPALTQTGTFTVSAPDGLQTLTVGGIAVVTAGVAAGFPASADTWHGSTLTITGYDPATGVVTYSYTLNYDADHPNAGGANSISEHFEVVATDTDGSTATGQLDVNIVDDTPDANPDATSVTEGGVVSGNVLWNDVAGADGPLLGGGVVGVRAGSDTSTPVNGGLNTQINGTYGYLTLDAQGNAEYHSYPNSVNGPGATDVFTYTLRDNDGDESTTTITIDVNNSCINNPVTLNGLDVPGGELTVYEKNLTYGTDPDNPSLTQTGTFTVNAPDGLQTLTVGGIAVVTAGVAAGFPQSADTWHGSTLTITGYDPATGVVTYSYTLNYDADHPNAGGANSISEHFEVVATDTDGSTATGQLDVNIVDDTPDANPDATSVTEGGVVSGNVLWNDVAGADGPLLGGGVVGVRAGSDTSTPVNGGLNTQINGTYGYLTLDAQGNAEYHSYPNSVNGPGATDVFTYTLRDNDGDESTTTITIDVNNSCINNPVTLNGLDVPGGELTVYEKNLTYGTDPDNPALTQTGTFTVSAPDGLQTLTVGGIAVVTAGVAAGFPASADTWHGSTLTITGYDPATGVVTYSYTLNYDADHPNAGGANSISEHFEVVATDTDGSTATGQLDVNIVDDTPDANPDATSVTEGGVVSGNVLWNDVAGADGPLLGGGVVGVRAGSDTSTPVNGGLNSQINGTYGYLTLDAQGNAEYHSYPNGVSGPGATDVFTYTLRDNDGDESTTTITIDVNNGCITPVTLDGLDACGGELTVYEKNLTYGTDPDNPALTQTGSFTVNAPDGLQTLTVGGIAVVTAGVAAGFPQTTDTWHGSTLTITGYDPATGVVSYSYTLNYDADHPNAGGANSIAEHFDVVATGTNGSTATGQLDVNIVDDTPDANPDATSVTEGGVVSGNVLWNDVAGADGPLLGGGVVGVRAGSDTSTPVNGGLNTQVNGTYGYLTLDAQGNAEYHSNPNTVNGPGATDTFTYTLRDNDGDESTTTITIDVNNSCIQAVNANDVTVITNVLSGSVAVPGEALLANATDANGDPLTASPTTFNTGWIAKGADFTGSNQNYSCSRGNAQSLTIARSAFVANTAAMTAVLVVSGALGEVKHNSTNDEDRITVTLKQGETLNLDHNLAAGHVAMEYSVNGGAFIAIGDGQTITATSDGTYQIHITNIDNNGPGHSGKGAENYQLTLTVDYSGAHNTTPDYHGTYTVNDHHGGSDSAGVTITYQDGHALTGTTGDDVLVAGTGDNVINAGDGNDVLTAGTGNNELHGDAGNDLLYSGAGNDLLDGGTGNDTASYTHASAGVKVDLSLLGAQNTLGAGTDTLTAIENLVGSDFDDTLTGDNHNNIITGGLGNDVLNGGDGDDLLIGGLGNNTLTGGAGADTFQWLKDNSGHDVVTDFTPGTDKLDLSQLLQGESGTAASLDDYLHFKVTGSGDSLVTSIDVSGMAGAAPNQTIDLAGVDLASHYGVSPGAGGVIAGGADTATIINGMLNDHSLKVDTV
ncbi:VCBS repeat-containing protein [Pseudomonas migulae]|uniref:retention module-containing protein n=1 Tax=Pseudomonas migulae TaxID=78543 RepID=UPI00209DE080|nr:retention module-containing protein [Pseudomonas migulae]MCP1500345.1 VCBS repeat-containing protein [Pseudomonas migulae]